MKLYVHPHKIEIDKNPINEKEIDITKCQFVFDDEITDNFVKDVYFTFESTTYQVANIQNNQCDIPYEVLEHKGQVEIGVVAYLVESDQEIKRYNPSPAYFNTWIGSLKEQYDNYEQITPTDKEQIEQQLLNISTQMNNLDVEASKEEHTTTITITRKDGTSYDVQVLDGEKGDKGDKGDPGAIKMEIVAELPTENIKEDTIYLVPITPDIQGNNYEEYIYVNGQWELLGKIGVQIDLTNYVQFTDYATTSKTGVVKGSTYYGVDISNGTLLSLVKTYEQYQDSNYFHNKSFISKGTLENVITGKGLVSKTDYANAGTGGVIKAPSGSAITVSSAGNLQAVVKTYEDYTSGGNGMFIGKGTLENVLTARIGDIQTLLDNLNTGSGV